MSWVEVPAADGHYTFAPGVKYAVLASVSKNFTVQQMKDYLAGKGFAVSYTWEQGEPTRAQFAIDDWLATVPPDTRDNHRWIYGEGTFDAAHAPWTIGQDAPWPFTVYHVAHVMTWQADAPLATSPASSASSLPSTSADAPPPDKSSGTGLKVFVGALLAAGAFKIALGRSRR